jgi:hypothetical protein
VDWFRVYDTIIDDPKILNLSMEFRWYFIAILASSSRQHDRGTLPSLKEIGVHLRTSKPKTERIIAYFIEHGFIDQDPTTKVLMIHGWNKRQYKSDVSTDRVKRFRNACGNVSEVLPHGRGAQTELPRDRDRDRDRTPLPPGGGNGVVCSIPIPSSKPADPEVQSVANWAENLRPGTGLSRWVTDIATVPYPAWWIREAIEIGLSGQQLGSKFLRGILRRFAEEGKPENPPPRAASSPAAALDKNVKIAAAVAADLAKRKAQNA